MRMNKKCILSISLGIIYLASIFQFSFALSQVETRLVLLLVDVTVVAVSLVHNLVSMVSAKSILYQYYRIVDEI